MYCLLTVAPKMLFLYPVTRNQLFTGDEHGFDLQIRRLDGITEANWILDYNIPGKTVRADDLASCKVQRVLVDPIDQHAVQNLYKWYVTIMIFFAPSIQKHVASTNLIFSNEEIPRQKGRSRVWAGLNYREAGRRELAPWTVREGLTPQNLAADDFGNSVLDMGVAKEAMPREKMIQTAKWLEDARDAVPDKDLPPAQPVLDDASTEPKKPSRVKKRRAVGNPGAVAPPASVRPTAPPNAVKPDAAQLPAAGAATKTAQQQSHFNSRADLPSGEGFISASPSRHQTSSPALSSKNKANHQQLPRPDNPSPEPRGDLPAARANSPSPRFASSQQHGRAKFDTSEAEPRAGSGYMPKAKIHTQPSPRKALVEPQSRGQQLINVASTTSEDPRTVVWAQKVNFDDPGLIASPASKSRALPTAAQGARGPKPIIPAPPTSGPWSQPVAHVPVRTPTPGAYKATSHGSGLGSRNAGSNAATTTHTNASHRSRAFAPFKNDIAPLNEPTFAELRIHDLQSRVSSDRPSREKKEQTSETQTRQYHRTMGQQAGKPKSNRNGKAPQNQMSKKGIKAAEEARKQQLTEAWGDFSTTTATKTEGEKSSAPAAKKVGAVSKRKIIPIPRQDLELIVSVLRPAFDACRYLTGTPRFEIQLGRILVSVLSKAVPTGEDIFTAKRWNEIFNPSHGGHAPQTYFSARLTDNGADADRMIGMTFGGEIERLFDQPPASYAIEYEVRCRTNNDQDFVIMFDEDGRYCLNQPERVVGLVNLHFPNHIWDARATMSAAPAFSADKRIGNAIKAITDTFYVPGGRESAVLYFHVPDSKEIVVENVLLRRSTRHACRIPGREDIQLQITEVHDLIPGTEPKNPRPEKDSPLNGLTGNSWRSDSPEHMAENDWLWYEASIINPHFEEAFIENRSLELGARTRSWDARLVENAEMKFMIETAELVVAGMDNVGRGNFGAGAQFEDDTRTQVAPPGLPYVNNNFKSALMSSPRLSGTGNKASKEIGPRSSASQVAPQSTSAPSERGNRNDGSGSYSGASGTANVRTGPPPAASAPTGFW